MALTPGSLTITDGGSVMTSKGDSPTSSSGIVGTELGAAGSVVVSASESLWEQNGGLSIGFRGEGHLTIEAGGAIHSVDGFVARLNGSSGTALITGTDSNWTVSDSSYLGGTLLFRGGTAQLTVADGGALVVSDTLRLWSSGTLTLAGGSVTVGTGPVETTPDVIRLHADGILTLHR